MRGILTQWAILCGRGFNTFLADRAAMAVMLLQVPLIVFLIILSFHRCMEDNAEADRFARVVHYFQTYKAPYEKRGETVPLYKTIIPAVRDAVGAERKLISAPSANQRAAIYFVLVSAAIWLGIIGACKDIVSERHVLDRETRLCVGILPFLLSKFTVRILTLAPQMAFMAFTVGTVLLDLDFDTCTSLWLILWLTAATASALGLTISSIAPTVTFALTLVPVLMIPQLILGGMLRPPAQAVQPPGMRAVCQQLTIQRWGFEAAIDVDPYAWDNIVTVGFSGWGLDSRYGELNVLHSAERGLIQLIIDADADTRSWRSSRGRKPYLLLGSMTFSLLTIAWIVLHSRFIELRA